MALLEIEEFNSARSVIYDAHGMTESSFVLFVDRGGSARVERRVIGSRYWKRRDGIIS